MIRMDIDTVVVGNAHVTSLVILKSHDTSEFSAGAKLPIRIGLTEALSIKRAFEHKTSARPMTHDLLLSTIDALGASVASVCISRVEGTTFFAQVNLLPANGPKISLDARPSDAISLAVRSKALIFADDAVLAAATYPDFKAVRNDEIQREMHEFHSFVENLNPEDFTVDHKRGDKND